MENEVVTGQTKRRWLQFSLRGLFVVSILIAVTLAYARNVHQQAIKKQALANALGEFDTYYTSQAQFVDQWKEEYFDFTEIFPDPWHNISMLDRKTIRQFKDVDLRRLKRLSLSLNKHLEDEDLAFLRKMPSLEKLNLRKTAVSDGGIVHLTQLTSLKELNIEYTKISSDGLKKLKDALPSCQIAY